MILQCYVDDRSMAALEAASRASGRPVVELAEAAIAEAAIASERSTPPAPQDSQTLRQARRYSEDDHQETRRSLYPRKAP